ncbi:MAG: hypothetical protein ACXAC7_12440 [Candidatus Hodarchaeales archaeon]
MTSSIPLKQEFLKFPLFKIVKDGIPEKTFIVESLAGESIQFQPWVAGIALKRYAKICSQEFFTILRFLIPDFEQIPANEFCEILPLSGALYYQISESFELIFNKPLPRVYLGARRYRTDTGWTAKISYKNLDVLPKNPFLILGDTIATGQTLYATFKEIKANINNEDPQTIAIFSIAGALPGIKMIKKISESIFPNTPMYVILVNALFGLDENGTDMPWLHPDTIYPEEYHKKILDNYGDFLGQKWCTIWDWGDRANNPLKHLSELKEIIEKDYKETKTIEIKEKLELFLEQVNQEILIITSKLSKL